MIIENKNDCVGPLCACRNCDKTYYEGRATADLKGYCKQSCVNAMAKRYGFSTRNRVASSRYAFLLQRCLVGSRAVYNNTPENAEKLGWDRIPEYCDGDPKAPYVIYDRAKVIFIFKAALCPK